MGDFFLVYDISESQKININAKYLNNVITKENLVDIYQILFQRQRERRKTFKKKNILFECLELSKNSQHTIKKASVKSKIVNWQQTHLITRFKNRET